MALDFKFSLLSLGIISCLALTACQKNDGDKTKTDTLNKPQIEKQIEAQPIKEFAKTPEDQHDIKLLLDFQDRFAKMSDEMETELLKMQKNGTLSSDFEMSRRQDVINSAFTMLKELDLKTEQGRYIQGLFYQYWEGQDVALKNKTATSGASTKQNQNLNDFIQAQKQLQHWQAMQVK